jgi:ribosomal protein S18 acetylase RimI-like enzyme
VVTIRPRQEGDLARCASLLRATHDADGYPMRLPEDPATFFVVSDALGAWVALADDDDVVGHVLLRAASTPTVMALAAEATGLAHSRLAVVGRLVVAPWLRRRGAGRSLLSHAAREAWRAGRQPVLDVLIEQRAAIALYERDGWRNAGEVRVTFSTGETVDELVFVGPADLQATPA